MTENTCVTLSRPARYRSVSITIEEQVPKQTTPGTFCKHASVDDNCIQHMSLNTVRIFGIRWGIFLVSDATANITEAPGYLQVDAMCVLKQAKAGFRAPQDKALISLQNM